MSSPTVSPPEVAASRPGRDAVDAKGPAAYIAEFVGTFFLVLGICGVISAGAPRGADLTDVALVHTLVLMAMVYAIGSISGCHVNPAVTLALAAIRRISPRDAGIYIACQLAGGVCAGLLVHLFFSTRGGLVDFGTPAIAPTYLHGGSAVLGLLVEALGAFVLMWAIMGTAVNPAAPKGVAGIAIGGALGVGVLIFGPVTGASFNPARWFGPALTSGRFTDFWLYILGPIIGAIAAAYVYRTVMELDERALPAQSPIRGESSAAPLATPGADVRR
jgi:MIP family channel proteins